jgi:hypothetical protein
MLLQLRRELDISGYFINHCLSAPDSFAPVCSVDGNFAWSAAKQTTGVGGYLEVNILSP